MMFALQQPSPMIVRIMPPTGDPTGLAEVLIGALGLTGFLVVSAFVLALLFAAGLFLYRFKFGDPFPSASEQRPGEDHTGGHITR